MSEPNRERMGSTITIDTYTADHADASDAAALAEMILVLQLCTCGQFLNRGTAVLIPFPYLLLRYVKWILIQLKRSLFSFLLGRLVANGWLIYLLGLQLVLEKTFQREM